MKHFSGAAFAVLLLALAACSDSGNALRAGTIDLPLDYPEARTVDVVDDYHGTTVPDPYRWMEEMESPEVGAWVAAQNELTTRFLEDIPVRELIRERLTELWNFEYYSLPGQTGGRYFYFKNDGLQAHDVLYIADSLEDEARVLLDPNDLSDDGTVALSLLSISDDAKYLAYGVSDAGEDWIEMHVRDVDTGEDLPERLDWVKFTDAAWTKDGLGFFYSRYDQPVGNALAAVNTTHQLYYHQIGTKQMDDKLVYERPDHPDWLLIPQVTEDGRYLVVTVHKGTELKNHVHYLDLHAQEAGFVELLDRLDARYVFLGNDGPVFWFQTILDAPHGRVIAIDTRDPDRAKWREIIPEAQGILESVAVVSDMFIVTYSQDVHSVVKVFDLEGEHVRDLELPGLGTAYGFSGKRVDRETFFVFTSFVDPPAIYRYDVETGESSLFKKAEVAFDPDDFVTEQVFYPSKDGTRVPMFLTYRKGLERDGTNPVYLYAYGGGHITPGPFFSVIFQVWMEMGGIYAQAGIRGGGEYGVSWWEDGRRKKKQNGIDDMHAAAEWLAESGWSYRDKISIGGGSGGGLLVGACVTQRPELNAAVIPEAGVHDMLRFTEFTIGWAWVHEFGDPRDPELFPVLHAYSPLHNVRPGTEYPAMYITAADHDDRVVPCHSYKFTAALQAAQAADDPILLHVETRAGHGMGMPTSMIIEQVADKWAFLARVLDIDSIEF